MRSFVLSIWCVLSTVEAVVGAPGPAFPALNLGRGSPGIEKLQTRLDQAVGDVLSHGKVPGGSWDSSTTSFALQVTSATETIWSSYHSASKQGSDTPHVVTGDSFFRIASISKTFTVYALLLEQLNLDEPVTKWLPELKVPQTEDDVAIDWNSISLRALASHQAGIYRDSSGPCFLWREVLGLQPNWRDELEQHGFPRSLVTIRLDLLRTARHAARVFLPNTQATYSNAGFSLLGAVLESAGGKPYNAIINSSILQPLQMQKTTARKPDDSEGVIPAYHNDWYKPFDADTATAGLYSTPNDLAIYLRSMLYPATLLPQARLNAWMKPATWTSSGSTTAYGLSWEIYRTTSLTPDQRPIDLVTKGGLLNGYPSLIVLIPEFQLALVILIAGAPEVLDLLRRSIIAALVPVADELLREEASKRYTGCYTLPASMDDTTASKSSASSIELAVDNQGPGLRITSWISLGTDFLTTYARLQGAPASKRPDGWQVRLLPSDPVMSTSTTEIWRAVLLPSPLPEHDQKQAPVLWDDYYATDVDDLSYAGRSLGEFRITINEKGQAVKIYSVGLRTLLLSSQCNPAEHVHADTGKEKASWKSEL
ncbi:hypothetical protein A1O1_00267 [Capronia coronata CBS 617.96]|uniref:Uncharacterized protein n=1 Tax=Capronia coronata CBS 617.96 TaxID=1182541 RepID=W9YRF8_9EURO|nr:uncharacterized protein A1O1_00267 [Capronia coronata CBS 617.96]EXJ95148.1 hypothetical protein A1O1_00267 [Capronia coronata CBS 617.96]